MLNAIDPIVAGMAANCRGKVIFFGADRGHPVDGHAPRAGLRTVYVEDGELVAAEGK